MKLDEWIRKKKQKKQTKFSYSEESLPDEIKESSVSVDLNETEKQLKSVFGGTVDFSINRVSIERMSGLLCYLDSMTNSTLISASILEPITVHNHSANYILEEQGVTRFMDAIFTGMTKEIVTEQSKAIKLLLKGYCLLYLEERVEAIALKIQNIQYRSISEPTSQTTIRGPKDAFTESAQTNISLIRRRIKNSALRFEGFEIGADAPTGVYIGYLNNIANDGIIQELRHRIQEANMNNVPLSGVLEEYITDQTITPFPLIYHTERPDTIAAGIMEGKIAVIVEEAPFVLLVPVVFSDFFRVSEDYIQPFMMVSFIRVIRYVSFMISLILPSIYVGVITYHQELIPTPLLISIIAQREGVPFPTIVEAFIMEITFEILREAGVRMPRAIGMTVSIVGGLVIGQAAVEAGLISNIMVIVVSLTAIAGFVSPVYSFSMAARLLRFAFMIIAASTGLYGTMLGLMIMVCHLNSLRSFGVNYMTDITNFRLSAQKDTILRLPAWLMRTRPSFLQSKQPVKQPHARRPAPPQKGDTSGNS
ncbi:spore germination protein [Priestia abyssalis]|uniref:spore germination protein n=1 Tax=Priestia abyssalis TaxID=1221450 RepID=UPI0009958C3B|nr:spore germination protein [Priestia abyssalis]